MTSLSRPEGKHFGFGFRAFKKFPELIPLVSILGFATAMATGFTIYALYQKPDVSLVRSKQLQPFERVNPEQPQKLHTINLKYQKIDELEALKKEIGSYKC